MSGVVRTLRRAGRRGRRTAGGTRVSGSRKGKTSARPANPSFRETADAIPAMIWLTDAKGLIRQVNKLWLEFTGGARGEILGRRWPLHVHPDDLATLTDTSQSALAARQPFKVEFRLRRTDGEYRWITAAGNPRFSAGEFVGYVGSAVDTTARRRNELALRDSERRYRVLADSILDVFFSVDRDLRCIYWNKASENYRGIPATEALGKPLYELFPDLRGSALEKLLVDALGSTVPSSGVCQSNRAGVPAYHEVFLYPSQGGLTVILKDVTARMQAEAALRESEIKYRNIFQFANDAIVIFDPEEEIILEVNRKACEIYGFTRDELVGMSLKRITRDVRRGEEQIRQTLRDGRYRDFETVQSRKDGSLLHFVVNASVVEFQGKVAVLSVNRLVSDREQENNTLRQAHQMLFETSRDAVMILDRAARIVVANPAATRLTGHSHGTLLERRLDALYEPQAQEEVLRQVACAFAGESGVWEGTLVRSDGMTVECELSSRPMELSGTQYAQIIMRDISERKQGEAALRKSEELMRRLVESTDDVITLQDPAGTYLYFSGPSRHPLSRQKPIGKTPFDFYPPSVASAMMDDHRAVLAVGRSLTRESSVTAEEGTLWFLDQLSPVRNEQGHVTGVVTISRNITARKFANDLLVRSEERYRAFIDQSADGIWRVELEEPIPTSLPPEDQVTRLFRSGTIAESNAALARMFGHASPKEIVGREVGLLIDPSDPRTLEVLVAFVRNSYRLMEVESRHVDQEGNVHYFVSTLTGAVENGALVRVWGNQRDVTARQHTERQLRLLGRTITSARDCITITDLHNTILFVNDAFLNMYGFAEEDLLGRNISLVRADTNAEELGERILADTLAGGWYGEILNRRKDGSTFPVELWSSVVRNDEGDPVALVGVARDITERKRAEEQIKASLREKEVLLKEIHHRVKNNLQIISSLLSLQSEYIKDPEMWKVFNESQSRVKSMALIHEKLYKSTNLAAIEFGEYLRELASQLYRSYGARSKGVVMETDFQPTFLGIDRAIPCGIIVNELLSNAFKYAFPNGKGGSVYLRLHRAEPGAIEVVVGDTGVGIPEDFDYTRTESLGLKLVTMLTKQLDGTIALVRNGGHAGAVSGTEFAVRFKI